MAESGNRKPRLSGLRVRKQLQCARVQDPSGGDCIYPWEAGGYTNATCGRRTTVTELKPCPFCGGKASIKYKWLSKAGRTIAPPVEVMEEQGLNAWFGQHQYIERYKYSVKAICNRCHARGKPVVATVEKYTPYSTTEEAVKAYALFVGKAIEAWNRRADDGRKAAD